MIDWKKLEDEVDNAIEKGCPIIFESKTIDECKYQQKVAEEKGLIYERVFNITSFVAAIGFPFLINGFIKNPKDESFIGGIYIIIALVLMRSSLIRNRFKPFSRIIIDAEKRILSEDGIKPEPPQETTNISSQIPENTSSRSGNIGQREYIKGILDLLKLFISATLAAMFLITIYDLQTFGTNLINVNFYITVLGFLFLVECVVYIGLLLKLKEMP